MPNRPTGLRAARLTSAGRGAVATVAVVGEVSSQRPSPESPTLDSLFRAANGSAMTELALGRIAFGEWGTVNPEELVVCRVAVDQLEIHCHGGDAAVRRVLGDLSQAGCEIVDAWDVRNGTADFLEAECQRVLCRTTTWRTTKIVLNQLNGVLRQAIRNLDAMATADTPLFTAAVDQMLRWSRFGLHLFEPWSIVLTGRPNVGKSSLINALLGYQRAIVFDEPGTTRDVVTSETAFDGWPVVLADTAGIRQTSVELESAGIAMAQERLRSADLRLVLIDTSQPPTDDDLRILAEWPDAIIVAHKIDLPDKWGHQLPQNAIRVSSTTGEGMESLQRELVRKLVPEVPPSTAAIPLTPRQVEILAEARGVNDPEERRGLVQRLFQPDC